MRQQQLEQRLLRVEAILGLVPDGRALPVEDVLARAYAQSGGNISKLALKLGMDRSHLYTKLKEFGLHSASAKKT